MPLYTFHCPDCNEDVELNVTIDDRNKPEPHFCGEWMIRKVDAPGAVYAPTSKGGLAT